MSVSQAIPPSEILTTCFSFLDWGDYARLACVQKSWSTILVDASDYSLFSRMKLGQHLLKGSGGLKANPKVAFEIFMRIVEETAELANPKQQTQAAVVENSPEESVFAAVAKLIAECHFNGEGTEKNPTLGLFWLKESFVRANDLDAAFEVAMIYEHGRKGVNVDVLAAADWLENAANAGHVEAMAELGLCFELGCGREQDDAKALEWYMKAAECGHVTAKFSLGEAFEEARGVPQSDVEACLWYYRAALAGDEDGKKALKRLSDVARIVVPGSVGLLDE